MLKVADTKDQESYRSEWYSGEVCLEENIGLGVGVVVGARVGDFEGQVVRQLAQSVVFSVAHLDALELRGAREDLQQTPQLALLVQRRAEELHGGVFDVVVRRDHTQVEGRKLLVILHIHTHTLSRRSEYCICNLGQ